MPGHEFYDYAVLRVVPRVERGEFVNVGILLSCDAKRSLEARIEPDHARLRALDPSIDLELLQRHFDAVLRVCSGGPEAGPIGLLPARARFHWLTAQRSSILQTSTVHMGRCTDTGAAMERLLERMVRVPASTGPANMQ